MDCNRATRKELAALPVRDWQTTSEYTDILIMNTGRMHASGWALMAIIGCDQGVPKEIAAYCDDICWKIDPSKPIGSSDLRTDMTRAGIVRMHGYASYRVGHSLSSTDVTIFNRK
ncbi:hypothetical protein A7J57_08765 [Agrobacterium tumefaciens]|uniref:Uncharacterized protein n=1 Tax=Agrobacterium tumefaciens TaxID=358 RepID=A0A176WXY5_AGRTU|nr:hypothetical protein A7J57_08765 [Agrobacterium tumefaciens]